MNSLAVAIAIILLPGLVASVICDKITVHSVRWGTFKYSVYSFLFGIFSYVLLQILLYIYQGFIGNLSNSTGAQYSSLGVWAIIHDEKATIPLLEVACATILAPVVAFIAAAIVNYRILNIIAQKLNVSQKYGDENLFSYFLNSEDVCWVYVRDKEKELTYFGRVISFSECDSMQEIVLSDVDVYNYFSSEKLYSVSTIYLSRQIGLFVIEVPTPQA